MTDEQIAALEREIRLNGPIVIWSGDGKFPGAGLRGLSFRNGLKEALSRLSDYQIHSEARKRDARE